MNTDEDFLKVWRPGGKYGLDGFASFTATSGM
jgi:hypothetical protein